MKGKYMLRGIDEALWRRVKAAAAMEGLTVSRWILKVIRKAVRHAAR
jgi:predicted HicB family RNase H-like nuclease